ncbi:hypothetical protein J6590_076378 [Homalodisca vitripennis]|nr:hypothetical protein J6590_076378 [Homalodisca vitripennis]
MVVLSMRRAASHGHAAVHKELAVFVSGRQKLSAAFSAAAVRAQTFYEKMSSPTIEKSLNPILYLRGSMGMEDCSNATYKKESCSFGSRDWL